MVPNLTRNSNLSMAALSSIPDRFKDRHLHYVLIDIDSDCKHKALLF